MNANPGWRAWDSAGRLSITRATIDAEKGGCCISISPQTTTSTESKRQKAASSFSDILYTLPNDLSPLRCACHFEKWPNLLSLCIEQMWIFNPSFQCITKVKREAATKLSLLPVLGEIARKESQALNPLWPLEIQIDVWWKITPLNRLKANKCAAILWFASSCQILWKFSLFSSFLVLLAKNWDSSWAPQTYIWAVCHLIWGWRADKWSSSIRALGSPCCRLKRCTHHFLEVTRNWNQVTQEGLCILLSFNPSLPHIPLGEDILKLGGEGGKCCLTCPNLAYKSAEHEMMANETAWRRLARYPLRRV